MTAMHVEPDNTGLNGISNPDPNTAGNDADSWKSPLLRKYLARNDGAIERPRLRNPIKARCWDCFYAYHVLKQTLDSTTYLILYLIPSSLGLDTHGPECVNTRDSSSIPLGRVKLHGSKGRELRAGVTTVL